MKARPEEKRYPSCCIAYNCGKCGKECEGCPDKPYLDAFKAWKARTKAYQPDPIWSPMTYVAAE